MKESLHPVCTLGEWQRWLRLVLSALYSRKVNAGHLLWSDLNKEGCVQLMSILGALAGYQAPC
jgi:hypothetical protein